MFTQSADLSAGFSLYEMEAFQLKQLSNASIKVKDGSGNWNIVPGIAGESAYEIAVRRGYQGTEAQWLNALETERAAAVASIQTKGSETLASIPNSYTALSNSVGLTEYDPQTGTYKIGDLCIHEGHVYSCWIDVNTPEAWDSTKWQPTDVDQEISKLEAETLTNRSSVIPEMNAARVPLRFNYGRYVGSTGAKNVSGIDPYRGVSTELIPIDQIDAIIIEDLRTDIGVYFLLYNSEKTFVKYLSFGNTSFEAIAASGESPVVMAIPRGFGYVIISVLPSPDSASSTVDLVDIANRISGLKYLGDGKYNPAIREVETIPLIGYGNIISTGAETHDYTYKRARSTFIETKKYPYIRLPEHDQTHNYKVAIRYLKPDNTSGAYFEIGEAGLFAIPEIYDRYAMQIRNVINEEEVIVSPLYAMEHIRLISKVDDDIVEYTDSSVQWEVGSLTAATGANLDTSTNRIRTVSYLNDDVYGISVDDGYQAVAAAYESNGTFVGYWTPKTSGYATAGSQLVWVGGRLLLKPISEEYKYRIVVKKTDDSTMTASESTHIHYLFKKPDTDPVFGIKEYDAAKGVYQPGDLCVHEGRLYMCYIGINVPEAWSEGKWKPTTINDEITKLKDETLPNQPIIDTELDCVRFPIRLSYGHRSNGNKVADATFSDYRRVSTEMIPTNQIDAISIDSELNVITYLYLFDSTQTFVKNIHTNSLVNQSSDDERIFLIPNGYSYVVVYMLYDPDSDPNKFDITKMSHQVYGLKFLQTEKYNPETHEIETIPPIGYGNITSAGETMDYPGRRMRSAFMETAKYRYIRVPEDDESYQYFVKIRYINPGTNASTDSNDIAFEAPGTYYIPLTTDRFCLQIYNKTDGNDVILSPLHALKHIRLIQRTDDIIQLNDIAKTTERLQQMSCERRSASTVQPLVLLHFSDLHRNSKALERIVQFRDYYSDYIDDVIHTGDSVGSTNSSHLFGTVDGAENFLNVIGNHDVWKGSTDQTFEGWHYYTEAQAYATYIGPFVSNWGNVTYQADHCYYFKDYTAKGVRLIVLDCMYPTQAQLTWFISALNGAKTAGTGGTALHVVVADHVVMAASNTLTFLDDSSFNSPATPRTASNITTFPSCEDAGYASAIADFVSGGGVIACWLCGHRHVDTLATYNNVLNIAVTTAGDLSVGRVDDARTEGTKAYDAFNLVGINTYRGLVYVARVGQEYNVGMGKMDTVCWDYINHRLVHTS